MSEETKPTPTTGFFNKKLLMSTYRMSEDVADMIIAAVNQSDHVKILVEAIQHAMEPKSALWHDGDMFGKCFVNCRYCAVKNALDDYRRATEGKS
jgi:hypothetical protein